MYSQNLEEQFILDFFRTRIKGILLDIGANDGKTFSNSLALIEKGWNAVLVEPSKPAFEKIQVLHKGRKSQIWAINCAIMPENGPIILHQSGHHLADKSDFALLSSASEEEIRKWKDNGVEFTKEEAEGIRFGELIKMTGQYDYDFITIDCEGLDFLVLKQINLEKTELICIEHNSKPELRKNILDYCAGYGMTKIIYENAENLLICKEEQ